MRAPNSSNFACCSAIIVASAFARPAGAADVGGPATLLVTGITDYEKDYVFYVYYPGAMKDSAKIVDCWWWRVETKGAATAGGAVQIMRPTLGYGSGDLALVAVPKKLADQNPIGDEAWFHDGASGVLRVKGDLKVVMLYSGNGPTNLDYRLDRRDGEFTLTLLNPGRLEREIATSDAPAPANSSASSALINALIGVGVLLLIVAAAWTVRKARSRPN
jgi:hypothetical protein